MSEIVKFENIGNVTLLTLNDPDCLNALSLEMISELHRYVKMIINNELETRCLVITGAGRGFCAGANLQDDSSSNKPKEAGSSLRGGYHPLLFELRGLEMPIVTAVNGAAAGVGMSFALMGDLVCASKQAFFLQAFARIGLVPDGGSTFMLPRLIGWGRAVELSMLAERLPAEKAMEWGLINRLYDDNESLMVGAKEIAQKLAKGPKSLALIRKAYWSTWQNSYEQQLDLEAQLQNEAGRTSDFKEGVGAFLEKRDAEFTGQ